MEVQRTSEATVMKPTTLKPTTLFPEQSRDLIIALVALALAVMIWAVLPVPVV